MTSTTGGPPRRRPVLIPAALLVAVSGLAVAVALGGLVQVPQDPPPSVTVGQEIDQSLFKTTIVDAVVRKIPPPADSFDREDKTVLDLDMKVYNGTSSSAPVFFFEESLLKITSDTGQPLVAPTSTATPSPSPSAAVSRPTWQHNTYVPGDGADTRLLPPGLTSNVIMRFQVRNGLTIPDHLTIQMGTFELHEDWFTRRHRPELVTDDASAPVIAATISLPVRQEGV